MFCRRGALANFTKFKGKASAMDQACTNPSKRLHDIFFLVCFATFLDHFFTENLHTTASYQFSEAMEGRHCCVKSVHIRSFSGPYFPAFGLNTERHEKTLSTDTFHAVPLVRTAPLTHSIQGTPD